MKTISLTKLDDNGWQKYFLMKQEILSKFYLAKYTKKSTWQNCKTEWLKNFEVSRVFGYNESVIINEGKYSGWVDHSFDRKYAGFGFDTVEEVISEAMLREVLNDVYLFMIENKIDEAGHWTFSGRSIDALKKINAEVTEELLQSKLDRENMDAEFYKKIIAGFSFPEDYDLRFVNEVPAEFIDKHVNFVNEIFEDIDKLNPSGIKSPLVTSNDFARYYESSKKRGSELNLLLAIDSSHEIAALCSVFVDSYNKETVRQVGGLTAVARNHRGKGLGKFVKANMYFKMLHENNNFKNIITDTMPWNTYMYKINEEFGFEPYKRGYAFKLTSEFLKNYLEKN